MHFCLDSTRLYSYHGVCFVSKLNCYKKVVVDRILSLFGPRNAYTRVSSPLIKSLDTIKCMDGEQNPPILRVFEATFSLDAAHFII